MNKSGESGLPHLVPDLREKAVSFSLESDIGNRNGGGLHQLEVQSYTYCVQSFCHFRKQC